MASEDVSPDAALSVRKVSLAPGVGDEDHVPAHKAMAAPVMSPDPAVTQTQARTLVAQGRYSQAFVIIADLFIRTGYLLAEDMAAAVGGLIEAAISPDDNARLREILIALEASFAGRGVPAMAGALGDLAIRLGDKGIATRFLLRQLDSEDVSASGARELARYIADGEASVSETQAETLALVLSDVPMSLVAAAVSLRARGQTEPARRIFSRLVERGVATEGVYHNLALMERGGEPARGLAWVEKGLTLFPKSPWLRIELANILARAGDEEGALREAEAACAVVPQRLPVLIDRLRLLRRFGRIAELLDAAEAVLGHFPDSVDAHLLANVAASELGDWRRAYEHAEAALRAQPTHPAAGERFLQAAVAEGRAAEAECILRQVFAADRARFTEHVVSLQAKLLQPIPVQELDERQVGRILALVHNHIALLTSDALWEVARVLMRLRRYSDATFLIAQALARDEGDRLPPNALALISDAVGYDVRPRLPSGEAEARGWLARELVAAGLRARATNRFQAGRTAFRLAAALGPEDMSARLNAAFAELEDGSLIQALKHFRTVERVNLQVMADVAWPQLDQLPWPRCRFDHAASFDNLKRDGAEWPLITVITPSFNQGRYLEDSILSVVNQGYPRLQYIMVDGDSTDESRDIISRYRRHFDHCIIEADRGQSEALNKGLSLARGEIISWINADDMLAPGALHMVALSWLQSRADLLFGICFQHRDGHFELANLPQARQETFSVEVLGDIFGHWLKGYFFYQPEVFFTQRILERVGGFLDTRLHYTMDYEFWLRCARAGARIEPVHWPVAFFRKHEEQKTSNLLDCVVEQARVRDGFVTVEPPPDRRREVARSVGLALGRRPVRVEIVSSRLGKIFSTRMAEDLAASFAGSRYEPRLVQSSEPAAERDLVLRLIHLQHDVAAIARLRNSGFDGPIVGWFWDNHHHILVNYPVAEALDVAIPGHAFAAGYLANRRSMLTAPVPLCVTQWSAREAERCFAAGLGKPRHDTLYGGFVRYGFARRRNELVERLQEAGFDRLSFLEETTLRSYFGRSGEDRFADWMGHKVSLCLPLARDLSQRLFDALVTGQVPIVSSDIDDLDAVIPPEVQEALPIIRFDRYEVADVREAHARALAAYDAGSEAAALERHRYALERHTFEVRISEVLDAMTSLASVQPTAADASAPSAMAAGRPTGGANGG